MDNKSLKVLSLGLILGLTQLTHAMTSEAVNAARSAYRRVAQPATAATRSIARPVVRTYTTEAPKITRQLAQDMIQKVKADAIDAFNNHPKDYQRLWDIMGEFSRVTKLTKEILPQEQNELWRLWQRTIHLRDAAYILKKNPSIANITLKKAQQIAEHALDNPRNIDGLKNAWNTLSDIYEVKKADLGFSPKILDKFLKLENNIWHVLEAAKTLAKNPAANITLQQARIIAKEALSSKDPNKLKNASNLLYDAWKIKKGSRGVLTREIEEFNKLWYRVLENIPDESLTTKLYNNSEFVNAVMYAGMGGLVGGTAYLTQKAAAEQGKIPSEEYDKYSAVD